MTLKNRTGSTIYSGILVMKYTKFLKITIKGVYVCYLLVGVLGEGIENRLVHEHGLFYFLTPSSVDAHW